MNTDVQPAEQTQPSGFQVRLTNFEGPFDLLLQLIFAHRLDVTEVALHEVTDEFIAYTKSIGPQLPLEETTAFLVVAATLLDLKAARLLPAGEVHDEEDLALLEVRDLLFARLLQYRAYKEVAKVFAARMAEEALRYPRQVPMEPQFAGLLPELVLGVGPEGLARIAARAFAPKRPPTVSTEHIYQPRASVREQAAILVARLRRVRKATFRALISDCAGIHEVVARFLAVLELYREAAVTFEQLEPFGDLHVIWTGGEDGEVAVTDDYDVGPAGDEKAPVAEGGETTDD